MTLFDKIQKLKHLDQNWDGYQGLPPTKAALKWATDIANIYKINLNPHWNAVPCSSGGIQLEMHAHGIEVEVFCDANGKTEGTWVNVFGKEMEESK